MSSHKRTISSLLVAPTSNVPNKTRADETRPSMLAVNAENSHTNLTKTSHILATFEDENGRKAGDGLALDIPVHTTPQELEMIVNQLLKSERKRHKGSHNNDDDDDDDEDNVLPYSFFINDKLVQGNIIRTLEEYMVEESLKSTNPTAGALTVETTIRIVYQPQAVFRIKPVTRCSASLPGHTEPVLVVAFSPDGKTLASGSGDKTLRFWDLDTQTPIKTCTGHTSWVLQVAWSADGCYLATGGMDGDIRLWKPPKDLSSSSDLIGIPFNGHTKFITAICWEPLHLAKGKACDRFASSSKDGSVRVWSASARKCEFSLTSHTMNVTCLRWGGDGLLYSGSQDRSIKVWETTRGMLVRTLEGHGHWVNSLSLSYEFILRTGAYDPADNEDNNGNKNINNYANDDLVELARKRYRKARLLDTPDKAIPEMMVSGSDDFTMFLWDPANSKKPIARLTGHQQLINHVVFSPDGRRFASASFDKCIKLWEARTGKFLATLRGHCGAIYQIAWSADSRLVVSGSKDSTLKVWDSNSFKLKIDLPGHADEVYGVDWSPDGERVVSGGKDKVLKVWRN